MPNHVTHTVIITGSAEAIKAFHEAFITKEGNLDFQKLLPRPEILNRTSSGFCKIDGRNVDSWIEDIDENGKGTPRLLTKVEQAELDAIGHTNWYNWSCANWGTKWNSYNGEWDYEDGLSEAVLKFDTAWSVPIPVLEALAAREECADLRLEIDAFDEGWQFQFHGIIENGELVEEFGEATAEGYERAYGYPPENNEE